MKFQKGDIVKIVDDGQCYGSYTAMAKCLNASDKWMSKVVRATSVNGQHGKIINMGYHLLHPKIEIYLIYLFEMDEEILMELQGLDVPDFKFIVKQVIRKKEGGMHGSIKKN